MDNDDVMRPNRLERQLAFIAEHPELAVASCLVRHIDKNNRVIGRDNSKLFTHEAVSGLVAVNELIGFSHPAAAFRKSAVLAVGGYRKQFFQSKISISGIGFWRMDTRFSCSPISFGLSHARRFHRRFQGRDLLDPKSAG